MPQPRERRVPTAPVDGVITVSDSARLMKREEFDALKTFVLPLLRAKGDPPPRIVEPGKGVGTSYFGNVRELLERTPGGTLVRGYKLFMYQLDPRMWRSLAWKAQFHVVVARAGESGKLLYECANKGRPGKEEYLPFIFVPSSRAHAEVSDEDMIANKFIMGGVVGGNSVFTDALVMDKKLRGRRFSVIATCPEACLAKRNIQVRTLPYFTEWFRLRNVEGDLQNLAEQFGMPCCNVGDEANFGICWMTIGTKFRSIAFQMFLFSVTQFLFHHFSVNGNRQTHLGIGRYEVAVAYKLNSNLPQSLPLIGQADPTPLL